MTEFVGNDKFEEDEIRTAVVEAIQKGLGKGKLTDDKARFWSTKIGEEAIERLALLKKPMKYLVFTDIQDNSGSGFQFVSSALWDVNRDGYVSVQMENSHVWVCVTVIGISL